MERRDALPGVLLRTWLDERVLPAFAERILPMDTAVAQRSAAPQVPDPRPIRDAFIAATARVHGLAVVPRTMRDFAPQADCPIKFLARWNRDRVTCFHTRCWKPHITKPLRQD